MQKIYVGNANIDGVPYRQWIVGSFIDSDDIRKTSDVEIKWGVHDKGFNRDWVSAQGCTTISILISGHFLAEFHDQKVELQNQGDYVLWGDGVDHRSEALEDSVILTVRWASKTQA